METNIVPGQRARGTQGRRSWTRIAGATGAALAMGAALLAVTGPAQAINAAKTGPIDAANGGFPSYYTDDAGISLQPCIDGSANCGGATATDDGAGGPGMAVDPDGEGFYWSAESTLDTARGSLLVIMAHEAAWLGPGQPTVFDRLRIRGHLNRSGTYTLLTPYGTKTFEAGPVADQRNVFDTEDLGCAMTAGGSCAGHTTNWLRSVSAPAGYLGDAATPTRVTGGTVRNEIVLLSPTGAVLGRTDQFVVMGKVAPGPSAALSATSVDFGNTRTVRQRSVVVRNLGDAPLSFSSIRVLRANRITVAPTGCAAGASLAAGASCRVNLVYRPGARRTLAGTLVINDDTIAGTHAVPVKAMTTSVFSSARRLHFAARQVGTQSHLRRVVVTNKGVVPMRIQGVSISGGNAGSFRRGTGQGPLCAKGARVRPGASCAVYVAFRPRTFGLKTSALVVRSNAASSPDQVLLNGRGR